MAVFHSSGITSRSIEIPSSLLRNIDVEFSDDFIPNQALRTGNAPRKLTALAKKVIAFLLDVLGLLSRFEKDSDFNRVRPWLLMVRGHYTNLVLTEDELSWISHELNLVSPRNFKMSQNKVAIHFRLGDLLHLDSKTYVPVERITSALEQVSTHGRLSIYSDSTPAEVKKVTGSHLSSYQLVFLNVGTLEAMRECIEANHFLGTNSKISLWIALFRIHSNLGESTFLPLDLARQATLNLKGISEQVPISAY